MSPLEQRIQDKERGIKSKSRSWGYGRDDKFKMKIGGGLVDRKTGNPITRQRPGD